MAPRALAVAREKALAPGLSVDFVLAEALDLVGLGPPFATVLDCGLFHTFDAQERPKYVAGRAAVTEPGGTPHRLCFSDQGPETGPHPVSREQVGAVFAPEIGWEVGRIVPERGRDALSRARGTGLAGHDRPPVIPDPGRGRAGAGPGLVRCIRSGSVGGPG